MRISKHSTPISISVFLPIFLFFSFLLPALSLFSYEVSVKELRPILNFEGIVATELDGFIECKIYVLTGLADRNLRCQDMIYEYAFIFILRTRFEEMIGSDDALAEIFMKGGNGDSFPFSVSTLLSDSELISLGLSEKEIIRRAKKVYAFTLKLRKNFLIEQNVLLREVRKIVKGGRKIEVLEESNTSFDERMVLEFIYMLFPQLKLR